NDGDLFAFGEALAGFLPWVNEQLAQAGSARRHRNLVGFTVGTGLGGGVVHDGRLLLGDNSAAGEVWSLRHRDVRDAFAEEGASIRGVRREYAQRCGIALDAAPQPREIAASARGESPGDAWAAGDEFLRQGAREVAVPGSTRKALYQPDKRTGVGRSRLGTSAAISLGAYAFALSRLDRP